ncbi:hypothetical protein M427DRAFT_51531 [Gonapodya prolifera JEL478]|uniref:Uncharacterized protein n=1 Tax=Gonapodya prolifera (strain JEL478) TaxID=1344416 RepID=A0A139AX62_GONPJ|nr:hypothetical protein M427DRAFT_51531 [Gonapodya prolifera JEL478]|eukprot:KXS21294.1 hypothetical protein M427DRAFT_51531 [Gonapodya prolifera JEL478]
MKFSKAMQSTASGRQTRQSYSSDAIEQGVPILPVALTTERDSVEKRFVVLEDHVEQAPVDKTISYRHANPYSSPAQNSPQIRHGGRQASLATESNVVTELRAQVATLQHQVLYLTDVVKSSESRVVELQGVIIQLQKALLAGSVMRGQATTHVDNGMDTGRDVEVEWSKSWSKWLYAA